MSKTGVEQLLSLCQTSAVSDDVADFLLAKKAQNLSPKTLTLYRSELRGFAAFLRARGVRETHDIEPGHVREYLVKLSETRNPGGCHVAYRVLKTWLRWYASEYAPERPWRNPIAVVQPPRVPEKTLPPLALPDLRRMVSTCDRSLQGWRDRAMLLALADTGCRASEFVALDIADVNLETGAVRIRKGKGAKARTAFIGAKSGVALTRYLRRRRDKNPALWVSLHGGERLTYWGLRQVVRRRAKMAGIEPPPLHSFRRLFALTALRAGVDLVSLQRLLGHANLSVLQRYLAQTEADLREAHQRAGIVDRML